MRPTQILLAISLTASLASATFAAQVTMDTVPVGNPGNAADNTGYGSVAYNYRIGTFEVTYGQYAEFLNAKAASDPLGLWNINMGFPAGGIQQNGLDGSFTYTVAENRANKPVGIVSYYDALRFANWMNNGQGNADTETGAYTLLGGTPTPTNFADIPRNPGAVWFLPNVNEWYKAAYHQPASAGGDPSDYWTFPTASNALPTFAIVDSLGETTNPGPNVVNAAPANGHISSVGGAGPLSTSYYGTYDQAGNVAEWFEQELGLPNSGTRRYSQGGAISKLSPFMRAGVFDLQESFSEYGNLGFRMAVVPEPSTFVLTVISSMLLAALWCRQLRTSAIEKR